MIRRGSLSWETSGAAGGLARFDNFGKGPSRCVERPPPPGPPPPRGGGGGGGGGEGDARGANRVGTSPEVRGSPEGPYGFEPCRSSEVSTNGSGWPAAT
ncbi:MAG: hypothetical protein DME24_10545 [Verrucomicrobia bacterium]|nr:MAG: hypothetical protein DME24_10545 [Verrucomicrobiota bacterium]